MAHLGPGVACVGSSGGRLLDAAWGGRSWKGDGSTARLFEKVERYGVVAVRRGQEVEVWVARYSAEVYALPVGRGGQGLLQGTRAWLPHRELQWMHSAVMGCGTAYMVKGPTALYVAGDDGAEVRQPCCAAFAMVYPETILGRRLRASRLSVLL